MECRTNLPGFAAAWHSPNRVNCPAACTARQIRCARGQEDKHIRLNLSVAGQSE